MRSTSPAWPCGAAEAGGDDTGGTTGMPRGVMWQHQDVFFAGLQGGNPGGEPIEKPEDLAKTALEREAP